MKSKLVPRMVLRMADGSEIVINSTVDEVLEQLRSTDIGSRSAAVQCRSFRALNTHTWRDIIVHIAIDQVVAAFQISDGPEAPNA